MIYKKNVFDKIMYKILNPTNETPYLITNKEFNIFMHLNNSLRRKHKLYEI